MDLVTYALSKKGMSSAVSDYLDEHLTNPTNPPIDTSLTIAGAAADSKATGDKITQLKEDLTQMYDPTPIYTLVDSSLITEKTNTFLMGGVEYSNSNWRTMTLAVEGGKEYRITAAYYSSIKCVTYFDENDTYISEAESSPTVAVHTVTITTPANATKMSINDKKSGEFAVYTVSYALKDSLIYVDGNPIDSLSQYADVIGKEIASNKWSIGKHNFANVIELYGSANGSFRYYGIKYNGVFFKYASDDITPINTDCGYIGANHGYNFGYKATLANHGLTVADIGKTCVIGDDTWVLIQVPSTSQFWVLCRDESKWWGAKTPSTVPTTFNFGTSITVTSITRDQIRPSVKNISVEIKENSYKAFSVFESYDIINLASGISAIIENVGNNDNSSIVELASDTVLTVRNVYEFSDSGSCVLVQNVKINNDELLFSTYGGTQSNGYSDNNNYYAVPMTNFDTLQAVSDTTNFNRSDWDDQSKPPLIYLQTDGTGENANRMFLQGIEMLDRNSKIVNSAGFVYTTAKMYPYAVAPASQLSVDETYSFMSYRIPMYAYDKDEDVKFCGYCKVGNSYYFFCYNPSAISKTITVTVELCGLNIETVIAKNASCLNSIVSTGIDVKITGEGYLLLKLS